MPACRGNAAAGGAARTLLEQRIRERRMTFEEFVRWAEEFARKEKEPGTLSLRHLQHLVAGRARMDRLVRQPLGFSNESSATTSTTCLPRCPTCRSLTATRPASYGACCTSLVASTTL